MKKVLVSILLFAAVMAFASPAMAQGKGFTIGLGLGLGHQVFSPDEGRSESENGLAGPTLKIGGFLQPNLAILFKATGTVTFPDTNNDRTDATISHYLLGPAVQFWPTDAIFLEAGLGYSRVTLTIEGDGFKVSDTDTGAGVMGALGYAFWRQGPHALGVSLELAAGNHDAVTVYSAGVAFNWQYM
ncbi:MAG: outer membrane beta-barrel protein [bacterium]